MRPVDSVTRFRSKSSNSPPRNLGRETWASWQIKRCINFSFDISIEKKRLVYPRSARFLTIPEHRADFPSPGLAPIRKISQSWKPPVHSSTFENPVEIPGFHFPGSRNVLTPPG